MGKSKEKRSDLQANEKISHENLVSDLKEQVARLEKELERKRKTEEALKKGEENFRDIFETVSEGIAYTTLSGKVLTMNLNLEKILEIPMNEIVGKNIILIAGKLLNASNLKKVLPILKEIIGGKEVQPFEFEYKNKILELSAKINLRTRHLTGTVRDITESKKTEHAFRVSEARLKRAELASRSGNWELHLDSGIMIGSEGARKLYGIKDFSGAYSVVKEVPLPEYRDMLDKALNDLIKENRPYDLEFKIRNQETGEILDIHSISEFDRANRILFGSIQDVTARKRAEEELKTKSRNLARLLELTMGLLETSDKNKVLQKIVDRGPTLMEMDSGAIYVIKEENIYLQVTSPPLPEGMPEEFRRARLGDHPHILKTVTSKSYCTLKNAKTEALTHEEKIIVDSKDFYTIVYVPLMVSNEVVAVLIFGSVGKLRHITQEDTDICIALSNIASLALENSFLFDNLVVAKEKAEESDRLKTAFLHNISHEIRTPLNAIIGFSGFLDQPDLTMSERRNYYDIIVQSNNQLLSIINDIINISHIESGQITLKEKKTDLDQVIENLYSQYKPQIEKKGLSFTNERPEGDKSTIIFTDENKLIQILTNLLNNAIKFTDRGYIRLGYGLGNNCLEFFVEDSGIGIAEAEQKRIFERFYQIDKSMTKIFGGTGLGLTISDAYVKLMGGQFSLKSTPGKGSLFSFTLPYKNIDTIGSEKTEKPRKPEKNTGQVKTIVVAEDEYSNYALIRAMLESLNYKIIHASNGQEAVDICNSNTGIDMVLMDIKMPLKDGFEATREILRKNPAIPIIAQTAYSFPDDIVIAKTSGCVECITKPFDKELLISIVKKYLA